MSRLSRLICHRFHMVFMLLKLVVDATHFLRVCLRPSAALAAEYLFLRKQLALYQAHHVKPRRATNATRNALVWLSGWFDRRQALVVVQSKTFSRWRRQGFRWLWRWTSRAGRPPIPTDLQAPIRHMARANVTWGQKRIANELRLKLGLRVSPRTVRKHLPKGLTSGPGRCATSQRWRSFIRNHAWDLIVQGVYAELTQGVQALSVWIIQSLQCWQGRCVTSRVQGFS